MVMVRTWIEPVVAGCQLASSFYDTGLILVVKGYYNKTNVTTNEDVLQKSISNFYIIYNLIIKLTPLLSAYILAKMGDKINRKITICVPISGFFISSLFLLFLILWDWQIEVMFGTAAFNGLCGWFTAYWAGVMSLASLNSSEKRRTLRLIIIECIFGLAGFVGSLISGHIFIYLEIAHHPGTALVFCSLASYAFCLMYVIFILRVPHSEVRQEETTPRICEDHIVNQETPDQGYTEQSKLIDQSNSSLTHNTSDSNMFDTKVTIYLLFVSATLYNSAVNGAEDVINFFVLKNPLSWGPVEVGYGNAAAYMIFITSFLGVFVLSRCVCDLNLVIFGMFSFCAGILIMAFVRWTYLYYIARLVMMFSLIPLPTIRAMLSKYTKESSYGKVFAVLQMVMGVVAVASSTAFIEIYQVTLSWFSGFSFIVICIVAFISFIPISFIACKTNTRKISQQVVQE
ncbi:solute carrier family 46 member 2-like [Pseudophryne corroboree]|uniref:solute carrier family 46 member 2-like n=1 Tax=Pseudophryne corroboree TaxID=495146 RepID=UPI0030812089